jgi:hypothetical protein
MEVPPHARAAATARGHRFAAYPRCSTDLERNPSATGGVKQGMNASWCAAVLLILVAGACSIGEDEMPSPRPSRWAASPAELVTPAPPGMPGPQHPVALSAVERSAIEQLRRRGASITVFAGSGEILVHFPLGADERRWRREGRSTPQCGMSIAFEFVPDDSGPAMTDGDLKYLDQLPHLQRVNLGGTKVTASAVASFRGRHPQVVVEERDDE